MSGRTTTLMIGQVWEHWRSKNRVRIDDIYVHLVRYTGDDGRGYSIDPEDLMSEYICIGELAP